jgi:hypothetical protein
MCGPDKTRSNQVICPDRIKIQSTEEAIIKENELTDPNAINVGQLLIIPVNLVTPTATRPPTSTPSTPVTQTQTP